MQSSKLSIKLFTADPKGPATNALIPAFQRWIREQAIPNHLLIDVADYAHVPTGPGTVLVTHEANYYLDHEDNRSGLLYMRKQPLDGDFREKLTFVLKAALSAAAMLENEPVLAGKVKFQTDELRFRIHDRLLAPNTPETFEAIRADLQSVLDGVFKNPVRLDYTRDPLRLFEVRITTPSTPIADLL